MKLKTMYKTAEEIPEGYADLYTEVNGQFELTEIEGVKTPGDVQRVQEALRKEKLDHKKARDALIPFEGIEPEQVLTLQTQLDEANGTIEVLKSEGKNVDEKVLAPIIEARVRQAMGPVEREKGQLQRDLDKARGTITEKDGEVASLKTEIVSGSIQRAVRDAATEEKVLAYAIPDVVMRAGSIFERTEDNKILTKDNVDGVTPGLTPKEWVKDQKEKSPHWWPASMGSGARGANGEPIVGNKNPWTKAGWNVTAQGKYVTDHGEAKARQAAESAGVTLGATKPAASEK